MKPEDIPQDVWDASIDLICKYDTPVQAIARATLQARSQAYEECAKIAEKHAGLDQAHNTRFVARNIATAVRSKANQ